jgi:hypothetical protein
MANCAQNLPPSIPLPPHESSPSRQVQKVIPKDLLHSNKSLSEDECDLLYLGCDVGEINTTDVTFLSATI